MKLNGTTLNSLQRAIVDFARSGYNQPYGIGSGSGFSDNIMNNLDKISGSWRALEGVKVSTDADLKRLSITCVEGKTAKTYEIHVTHHLQSSGERALTTTFSITCKDGRAVWVSLNQPFRNAEPGNLIMYLSIGTMSVPLHEFGVDEIPGTIKDYLRYMDFVTDEDLASLLKVIKAYLSANCVSVNW